MVNHHGCINGTLQGTDKYSAPVPVIGLYIAAASAVCALLMLYDILHGFIKTQRWLPCKWFKLNSVTLSLIGVVVKLTVDLTTIMPSALDQLSKLAGTTSLCIYMSYIYPSISDMKDSTNMFALSILVITVCVNICIQLSTGVIVLFIPEHIVVMCIMLLLLAILWRLVFLAKNERRDSVATVKSEFMTGKQELAPVWERPETFLQRLKDCYLGNYQVNPQFLACRKPDCGTVGDLCLISLSILIQAAIRSIVLKKENLCTGMSSDYRWSMGMIVVTQFVFIIIGSFASCFRRWTMFVLLDLNFVTRNFIEEPYRSNPMLKGKYSLVIAVETGYKLLMAINFILVTFFIWVMSCMRKACIWVIITVKYCTSSEDEWRNSRDEWLNSDAEFKGFLDFFDGFNHPSEDWIERKSASNMEKLIERSERKSNGLFNLLSSIIPVQSVIGSFDSPRYQEPTDEIQLPPARLHPLVVLVRLMEVAIPKSPSQDKIVKTFRQAFETLDFIEKHMHNTTLEDIKETEIAKALWRAGDFGRLLPVNLRSSDQSPPPVDHAFHLLDFIYEKINYTEWVSEISEHIRKDSVTVTVRHITGFLKARSSSSGKELENFMQDLFVYLLNIMLAQLPDAIFKAVSQSPDDEFEERVRQSLSHLCIFKSWDATDKWKPPQGFKNCSGLFNPPVQDEGEDWGDEGNEIRRRFGR